MRKVVRKVREVYLKEQDESIATHKPVDKRKVRAKSKMVDRILNNCVEDKMDVTKVNRLLYTGAWVVTEELGMIGGKMGDGKREEKKKPHSQRRIEKSIGKWRKYLGRVEELRKTGKLNDEAIEKLDKKYNLLEKGCFSVSTFLKNKIQTGSIKIKKIENKVQQQRHNQLFKNNQSQLYKELSGSINQENPPPDAAEAVTF